jgi:hypothetical protein
MEERLTTLADQTAEQRRESFAILAPDFSFSPSVCRSRLYSLSS